MFGPEPNYFVRGLTVTVHSSHVVVEFGNKILLK
jgi:hypothetical protein